ncbi:DUF397 domain-containing protein [Streptomyces tsukubensis]|uniref:Uncharacterized protein n=1 Tax=Streptomyces tsukubensis TaxID=83656 RepID=A0A1V4A5J3_9ACTN|nr:DUF397 domain-containing protein [Streptomyces tsukubensis]OON75934.1 hypothetical protein B1H18_21570 [Streptomyces tsukubensis]QFR94027.1 DUF397 domain-containing protein [Streptomyces tsukubensis]
MTDEALKAKKALLNEMLDVDQSTLAFIKSEASAGGSGDCLEVAKVQGKGYLLRHSILTDHLIPLTESEYVAYCKGVRAGQESLLPDSL